MLVNTNKKDGHPTHGSFSFPVFVCIAKMKLLIPEMTIFPVRYKSAPLRAADLRAKTIPATDAGLVGKLREAGDLHGFGRWLF